MICQVITALRSYNFSAAYFLPTFYHDSGLKSILISYSEELRASFSVFINTICRTAVSLQKKQESAKAFLEAVSSF
jgi:hypothetical protein